MLRQFSARNLLGLIRLIFLKLKYRSRVSGFFFIGAGPRIFIGKQGSLSVGQGTIIIEDFVIRAEAPVEIGKDVFFNRGCHVVAKSGISIGDRSLFGEYVSIHDEAHAIQGGKIVGRNDFISRPITIGSDVWVGAKATILPGVTIGDRAIIGANAVVSKDVEPGVVVGGIPARFIKKVTDNYAGASELDIRRNSSSRPRD